MAGFPKVTILFSDGNLLKDIAAIDGIAGIVGTVDTVGLIGVPKQVFNLEDAKTKGFTEDAEPFLYRQIKEFYDCIAGNQELWIMGVADSMTMAQMLDKDDDDGAKKLLLASKNKIRLLGVCRRPDGDYDPGEAFYDSDVDAALLKTIAFGADQNAKYNYLRILVEGRVVNEESVDILQPVTIETKYGGLVVGGSQNDGSASIGLALGRACQYEAHIKIGKVANGPLPIDEVYIGTKKIEEIPGLESLHESGIISFMNHPQKAGFYFGIDRMANTGDYRRLVYGRIIDKAAIITVATYVEEIQDEVDIEAGGRIAEVDAKDMENRLNAQVLNGMGHQISGFETYINPEQDVINTETVAVKARVRPKGYKSFIDVDLGLTAA